MNWNKVAGWYAMVLYTIGLLLTLFYIVWYLVAGRLQDSIGIGAAFLFIAIIAFILLFVLLFISKQAIKGRTWAKIIILVLFVIGFLYSILAMIVSNGIALAPSIITFVLNLIGVVLFSLSFKKNSREKKR